MIEEMDSKVFSQRLRVALAAANISRPGLAKACSVSTQAVARWVQGATYPSSSHLVIICNLTGASMDWIFDGSPVDIRSTAHAPDGVHLKDTIREVIADMGVFENRPNTERK